MTNDDLLDQAAAVISEARKLIAAQVNAPAQIHPTSDWVDRAKQWQAKARHWSDEYAIAPTNTRWRPIDSEGNISLNPAPENPDDPDESETGPAEVQL